MITACGDASVRLFDAKTGTIKRAMHGHGTTVTAMQVIQQLAFLLPLFSSLPFRLFYCFLIIIFNYIFVKFSPYSLCFKFSLRSVYSVPTIVSNVQHSLIVTPRNLFIRDALLIELEATEGTYELRSYGGEQ